MPRFDAIVYRTGSASLTGAASPDYVSEHASSCARDADFHRSLLKLSSLVRSDMDTGLYIPHDLRYVRPFVTCINTVLSLRDGTRTQPFLACTYESVGHNEEKKFLAMCPTNYLSNTGRTLGESLTALGEVIQTRYRDETVCDLMRELPKTPLVTTFAFEESKRQEEVCAAIKPDGRGFRAYVPGTGLCAKGADPYGTLQSLECTAAASKIDLHEHVLRDEPIFGAADVKIFLRDSISIKRFLISISPCQNGSKFYDAYAPQANVAAKSRSIDGVLQSIGDAIALQFHESSLSDVEKALSVKPILTTARICQN